MLHRAEPGLSRRERRSSRRSSCAEAGSERDPVFRGKVSTHPSNRVTNAAGSLVDSGGSDSGGSLCGSLDPVDRQGLSTLPSRLYGSGRVQSRLHSSSPRRSPASWSIDHRNGRESRTDRQGLKRKVWSAGTVRSSARVVRHVCRTQTREHHRWTDGLRSASHEPAPSSTMRLARGLARAMPFVAGLDDPLP